MTKIIATFSNGHTDTYNGKRDVKAAWAIIRKRDGKIVMSGHSLDLDKARKTSASNISSYFARGDAITKPGRDARQSAYWNVYARKNGYADWKAWYAADQIARAKQAEGYTTEVVAL